MQIGEDLVHQRRLAVVPGGVGAEVHVLVVEDDPALLRAMTRLLRRAGFTVTSAGSFRTALQGSASYDLAVLDLELGDGSGVVLARRLLASRRIERAVFHTGCGSGPVLALAAELGPVVFKSGDFDALLAVLDASARRGG